MAPTETTDLVEVTSGLLREVSAAAAVGDLLGAAALLTSLGTVQVQGQSLLDLFDIVTAQNRVRAA